MTSKWAAGAMSLTIAYFAYHAFAGEQVAPNTVVGSLLIVAALGLYEGVWRFKKPLAH